MPKKISTTTSSDFDHKPPFTAAERAALRTDHGMAAYLTGRYGRDLWTYDPSTDTWFIPNFRDFGPGKLIQIARGGDWRSFVVEALS